MISYWQELLRPLPSLSNDVTVDVAIIGAGYTGLWTAEVLSRRGLTVGVVESEQPGWGASGRNGGLVIPGLALLYPDVVDAVGSDAAEALYLRTIKAQALIRQVATESPEDIDYAETGSLYLAADQEEWARLEETKRLLDKLNVPSTLMTYGELPQGLRGNVRPGGLFMNADGRVHPLKLIQVLIQRIIARGSGVWGNSRVLSLDETPERIVVHTARGKVTADYVVVATNASTMELFAAMGDHIQPVRGQMLVTTPVPALDYNPASACQ